MDACSARYRSCIAVVLLASLGGCQSPGGLSDVQFPWSKTAGRGRTPAVPTLTDSGSLRPEQKADIQFALGIAAERRGRTDEAKKIYLEVVKAVPGRADAHHRLALLHDRKGACPSAEPHYQQAIRLDPKNAQLHCDLGYSYYLQQRWEEAEASLRRAVALDPELSRAHNNLGLMLGRTGRNAEALEAFAAAGCGQAEAYANLAYALALADQTDDAVTEFRRALRVDPNLKTARDGLASLETLAGKAAAGDEGPGVSLSVGDVTPASYHESQPASPGILGLRPASARIGDGQRAQ